MLQKYTICNIYEYYNLRDFYNVIYYDAHNRYLTKSKRQQVVHLNYNTNFILRDDG